VSDYSIGIVGAGTWGRAILGAAHDLGLIIAFHDTSRDVVAEVRATWPSVLIVDDFDDLLALPIEAIAIATPAHTHVELAQRAMKAGKDVLIRAPLAVSEEGATTMRNAAERLGRKVLVSHFLLFHPSVVALRAAIGTGAIGKVLHVRSRRLIPGRINTTDNVWWSFAPHDLAFVLCLLGTPTSFSASEHGGIRDGIADFVYADLQFPNDATAHLEVSWLDPERSSRIDVFGTKGALSVDTGATPATLRHRASKLGRAVNGTIPIEYVDEEIHVFPDADPVRDNLRAFVAWSRGDAGIPYDVALEVHVIRILTAIAHGSAMRATEPILSGNRRFVGARTLSPTFR
jgi:predicted dehydrogenase